MDNGRRLDNYGIIMEESDLMGYNNMLQTLWLTLWHIPEGVDPTWHEVFMKGLIFDVLGSSRF
jgi:hypothetical protein